VLAVAVAVALLLLAWWRGLHLTSIARRRMAMLRGQRGKRFEAPAGADVRTTAVLAVTPPVGEADALPLELIAGYLNRYGVVAEAIRVTSRDTVSEPGAPQRDTWIGLTLSGAANLAALQARSPHIPLHETAEVAVRRLADHLRESGWEVATAGPDDVPELLTPSARETWQAAWEGDRGYVAAYHITPDAALPDVLAEIWAYPTQETWTAVEIAESGAARTLAAACALRTQPEPGSAPPLAGLTPQRGNQLCALRALHPLSTNRLDGHAAMPDDMTALLEWPSASPSTPSAVNSG
jgi:type VII secretion protein EccE